MEMIPDLLENRLDKLSRKYLNVQNGVRMKSWQLSQVVSVLQSESNIQNVLDLDSLFPCAKSDVVTWWRTLEIFALGPQSTSLVLHIFHVPSTLGINKASISENENVQKSWCSINCSKISNTIMLKNGFTFESKVSNVVVSKQMMPSSFSPSWLQVVLDLLQWHSNVHAFILEHGTTTMLHGHNQQCFPSSG